MNRRILTLFAAASLLLGLSSCSEEEPKGERIDTSPIVVVLFSPYGMQDVAREQKICEGILRVAEHEGLRTLVLAPDFTSTGLNSLKKTMTRLKDDKSRHLFIMAGSGYKESQYDEVIDAMDNVSFNQLLVVGPAPEREKLHRIEICSYGSAYIAGALAVKMFPNEEAVVGGIYDSRDRTLQEIADGFTDGTKGRTPEDIRLWNYYSPYDQSAFFSTIDDSGIPYLYNDSYDFAVFAYKPFLRTIISCPEIVRTFYTLGIDADLSTYSPMIPFSCVRHLDKLMEDCIMQWLSPEGLPHEQWYGLDSEYAELVLSPGFEYLQETANDVLEEAVRKEKEYVSQHTTLPDPYGF